MRDGTLRVVSLSSRLVRYSWSLQLQEALAGDRKADAAPDTLLVLQHHPVFTVGKRGSSQDIHTSPEELQRLGIDVHHIARGGETTYHGPGQLVAYPLLNLRQLGLGARAFVEGLEDAMCATAGCFGIQARGRVPGKTGVWVGERKLGAVGVRISHGISSHGIAFNVSTHLPAYKHIVPCGSPDKDVTSLLAELQRPGSSSSGGSSSSSSSSGGTRIAIAGDEGQLLSLAEACLVDAIARTLRLRPVAADAADVQRLLTGQDV